MLIAHFTHSAWRGFADAQRFNGWPFLFVSCVCISFFALSFSLSVLFHLFTSFSVCCFSALFPLYVILRGRFCLLQSFYCFSVLFVFFFFFFFRCSFPLFCFWLSFALYIFFTFLTFFALLETVRNCLSPRGRAEAH